MAKSTKSTAIKKRSKTDLNKEKFIALFFKHTGNISHICKMIGIHRTTYYQWLEKDKKFREIIEAELEGLIDFVESKLFNLINDKNVAAVIFFLKTRAKDRGYVEKTEIEHTGELKLRQQFEDRLDEYFEEQGRDGIVKFFNGLETVVVPGNKRTNH